jgi:hypothetical protein
VDDVHGNDIITVILRSDDGTLLCDNVRYYRRAVLSRAVVGWDGDSGPVVILRHDRLPENYCCSPQW